MATSLAMPSDCLPGEEYREAGDGPRRTVLVSCSDLVFQCALTTADRRLRSLNSSLSSGKLPPAEALKRLYELVGRAAVEAAAAELMFPERGRVSRASTRISRLDSLEEEEEEDVDENDEGARRELKRAHTSDLSGSEEDPEASDAALPMPRPYGLAAARM
mmetsp:Transcript_12044/g.38318  ORF Transcript_12044/g.38318 Transcript_12044/m.38318 type:complete len:161 (+) Transcript_12044:1150-1632(+)